MEERISPQAIFSLGLSFWGAKALLSAVDLGLFTELAKGAQDVTTLAHHLGLDSRRARDFFDALVALGMLQRDDGQYSNTPETDMFLDRNKGSYIGGLLEMADSRLYPVWGSLTEALTSGQPQNEAKEETDYYANLCSDPIRLRGFLYAMSGLGMETQRSLRRSFRGKTIVPSLTLAEHKAGSPRNSLRHINISPAGHSIWSQSGSSLTSM